MNKQKLVAFLYANRKHAKKKSNKIILFIIASKNLGINLTKKIKQFNFKKVLLK